MTGWVNGIGWVTAAGCNCGRNTDQQPLLPGTLEIPKRKQVFAKPDMRFGRLDQFSRIGLAAIAFCLRDAGEEAWDEKRPIGIIAASRYGCLQTDIAYLQTLLPEHGKLASPNLFAYTLANSFLGEAALRFGLTGQTLVFNQDDASGLAALHFALEELTWSEQQAVVTGICDLNPPPELAIGDECPGSLFLLLGKEPSTAVTSYGKLELRDGELFFSGARVADFRSLVAKCLAVGV
ncbi:3-oxoacyl-[acyl-carrier-protein] synthase II [Desulfuromusa kysingii]|uniref:3-oxoacyl-[acyl-carrier-protein] synthase II n=1 Tax=Desulfuromusa kysingii TaxID=37625 RepID=A0A1H3VR98_9BACT|nr:beta-ketoacyl synthase N-terminal-like domain-containing protein [Desulfuromusa kysingii]SDZ76638.1 3-oxoacyl-[acyl-carrier-protein] synthase II [Desulfuromusa kysingii]